MQTCCYFLGFLSLVRKKASDYLLAIRLQVTCKAHVASRNIGRRHVMYLKIRSIIFKDSTPRFLGKANQTTRCTTVTQAFFVYLFWSTRMHTIYEKN